MLLARQRWGAGQKPASCPPATGSAVLDMHNASDVKRLKKVLR